jgi:predicted DNA-binding transcriptional regulator AlpA
MPVRLLENGGGAMSRSRCPNIRTTSPQAEYGPTSDDGDADVTSVRKTARQAQPAIEPLTYRKRSAAIMIGISERTIERLISAGKFPRADAYAGKCPLWTRESLVQWIAKGGRL